MRFVQFCFSFGRFQVCSLLEYKVENKSCALSIAEGLLEIDFFNRLLRGWCKIPVPYRDRHLELIPAQGV